MIIDLTISAEALFSTGIHFKKNLKHRLSTFIARDETETTEIAKKIGDLYDYRGAIVHGGTKKRKIALNEIMSVKNYVKRAIDKALSLKLYEKKGLINHIDEYQNMA